MRLPPRTSAVDLLWRALVVFRIAALAYAVVVVATSFPAYDRPALGWVVAAGMAAWTGFASWAYTSPARRGWRLLGADLAVALGFLAASPGVLGEWVTESPLTGVWVAAPVMAWAIHGGAAAGAAAALAVAVADFAVRTPAQLPTLTSINVAVMLLLAGGLVGYLSQLAGQAQQQLQRAVEREAAIRERERLARGIHDSVLQVLALVQRRGAELGGEAAQLGRLAGEQAATLRALVAGHDSQAGTGGPEPAGPTVDLCALLTQYASAQVTVAAPAPPVPLPDPAATELAAAVRAALDNVRDHCGPDARAWVLLEADPAGVTVTVRDAGPGIAPGRLAQAAADGRLGVAQSIQGRMRDLGGTATVTSVPGQGTEVELHLPAGAGQRSGPVR